MPPPASQMVKPNGLWSRPSVPWANGVRPNSPAQTTSVVVEQAAGLQVLEQAGDRLIDGAGVVLVALLQVRVLVPAVVRRRSGRVSSTNRTPRSTSRRASRHCRPKICGLRYSSSRPYSCCVAVGLAARGPSAPARPSACGRPARSWRWPTSSASSAADALRRAAVELAAAGRACAAASSASRLERADVGDRVRAGLEERALIRGRQEAAVEVVEPAGRDQAAVEDDEARQVAGTRCPGRR